MQVEEEEARAARNDSVLSFSPLFFSFFCFSFSLSLSLLFVCTRFQSCYKVVVMLINNNLAMLRLFLFLSDWVVLCKCWWEDSDDGAERLEKRRKGKQTQSNHKQQQQHDKKTWLIIKLLWCCCYCHAEVLQDWKAVPQMRIKKNETYLKKCPKCVE